VLIPLVVHLEPMTVKPFQLVLVKLQLLITHILVVVGLFLRIVLLLMLILVQLIHVIPVLEHVQTHLAVLLLIYATPPPVLVPNVLLHQNVLLLLELEPTVSPFLATLLLESVEPFRTIVMTIMHVLTTLVPMVSAVTLLFVRHLSTNVLLPPAALELVLVHLWPVTQLDVFKVLVILLKAVLLFFTLKFATILILAISPFVCPLESVEPTLMIAHLLMIPSAITVLVLTTLDAIMLTELAPSTPPMEHVTPPLATIKLNNAKSLLEHVSHWLPPSQLPLLVSL